MTGEHNALFYRKNRYGHKSADMAENAVELNNRIPLKYMAQGEALGAVAFLKRTAPKYFLDHKEEDLLYQESFPSTARIALADILDKIAKDNLELAILLEQEFDEELVYAHLNNQDLAGRGTEQELKIVDQIYRAIKKNHFQVTSYYAVIIFDGDNMGKWLSGKMLSEQNKEQLTAFHKHLSQELAQFARKAAEKILTAPKGVTVYAGGDDFLGFVNLNYLPGILKELRAEFDKIDVSQFSSKKLTFSAGVAVSHFMTPLSVALQWARRMEKEAKNMGGKDALSLAVLKRSGEIIKFKTQWLNSHGWFADQLKFLLDGLRDHFTTNFINQFCAEFIHFEGNMKIKNLDGMVDSELGRLLTRSYLDLSAGEASTRMKQDKEQKIAEMKKVLNNLYIENNLEDFLGLLEIISFLAKGVEIRAVAD
ncbi:type III-B CRISPR-associated protein Cas10/Cmr2 [Dehalobacterium formicoaceticum]|uniref:type III-B CRISPR-associated protein Cas10/Cmr2 n=1 Tax=Dehalobacterium formicoaceticum TaxID=51515 RepID=UPI000B7F343C|nr:type III-B CRISPR-associated protein Cas10/Cmr2 [Dehalobacterium formicoaceticum]